MSTASTWLWLGLLMVFVLVNGLFVAIEFALIRLRKTRIEEMVKQGVRGAKTVQNLSDKLDDSVAGAQLGITIMGLASGAVGVEPIKAVLEAGINAAAHVLPQLSAWQVPNFVAMALSFIILTFLHVIIGEQVPKLVGLRSPEKIALALSVPFVFFCRLTSPFLWLIAKTTALFMRLPGMPRGSKTEEAPPSVEELMILVQTSTRAGTLGKAESNLVQRALEYRGLTVKDVMVPASHMDCLPEDMTLMDALDVAVKTKHSRLPLYRQDRRAVVGVLRTRELLDVLRKKLRSEAKPPRLPLPPQLVISGNEPIGKLTSYIRKPFFVKADTPASSLLEELKTRHLQLAIVVNDVGEALGLVTQEDLVEQLVGEIHDEDDGPVEGVFQLNENQYRVEGALTLYEFRRVFDARLVSSAATTIAEVFLENYRGEVVEGARLELNGFALKVLACKHASAASQKDSSKESGDVHIDWLEVTILPEGESREAGAGEKLSLH